MTIAIFFIVVSMLLAITSMALGILAHKAKKGVQSKPKSNHVAEKGLQTNE